jgi:hypothetical protein
MAYMYGILAVIGWTWTVLFAAYLFIRLSRKNNEKQL